ncbi:aldo/keto reductase [Catenisphaera adipataccumulans]|uniref:Diketogulonate reductase-like aldo/keto reductase n=1 Tax=Catenisphaera adipataccumulans TaxID=700500 RepID=A0A7W8CY99_9FIRM|nr:aldo/keto reductase [Catenisphaera adipataccumulans]MBB5182658.1 diketogulonate reductase-like aldo/keto reductase [Catenisphaera adipataccumulans]
MKLNTSYDMPQLGIGTYMLMNHTAERAVYEALKDGYRLIDTARIYGNERGVGKAIHKAIQEGIVRREDLFVTTKMWTSDYGHAERAVDASLKRLGLTYIDLMILHHSQPRNDIEAYQAMEKAAEDGKLRSIGLSNYYSVSDFERLIRQTTIHPAVLQNELHPFYQDPAFVQYVQSTGTVMEAWFPLGGRGDHRKLMEHPVIKNIAGAHHASSAQVILAWHLQKGFVAVPGSSNRKHIAENIGAFQIHLSDEEMNQINRLDTGRRFASY